MKKNIYIIMSEAEVPELETLLKNAECEIPEGVSAENIAAKVQLKKKKVQAKARTRWARFGALAACFALIVTAVPTAQYILGATAETKSHTESLKETAILPSIAYPTSISYTYYLPLEDGTCLAKEIFYKTDNGKLNMTWQDNLAPFFEHCKLNITVADSKVTTTGTSTQTSPDGQMVTHTFGITTLHLYLESEEVLDDHTLKCLVNTVGSITYAKYIKLYHNGEPVAINGKCPEEGFLNHKFDTAK